MSYSCSDFVDTVLDALKVDVPQESWDSPSDQADLALDAIGELEKRAKRFALDGSELATVLAALRLYQREGNGDPANRPDWLHDIATDGGNQISLDGDGIDALCQRLNCGSVEAANG